MSNLQFSWIDYTLFVLVFLISAAIGVYYGFFVKQQKTPAAYLLGDNSLNFLPVAMSLAASLLSSFSLIAFPTEVYLFGTIYLVGTITQILVGVIIYYSLLPVYWQTGITTIYEYLEIRFDASLRTIASSLFTIANFFHMSFVIYAPSLAFSQVTGFNIHAIAFIMCVVCIFYTTMGGLKAVIWADTLQLFVMLLTLGVVLVIGIISLGGFKVIWDRAEAGERLEFFLMDTDPTLRITFWSGSIGAFTTFGAYVGTNPYTVQRFLAVRNLKESRKVLLVFIALYCIMQFIASFTGIIMYAKYYDCDPLSAGYIKKPDQILPYYVSDIATRIPGLSGLFISGLFSASLSTLSTMLNSLSGLIYDVMVPFIPQNLTDQFRSNLIKSITVVLGVLGFALIFVIERLGTLLETLTAFQSISLSPLLGMFILGMVFPFSNTKGALSGVIVCTAFLIFYNVKRQMYAWNGAIKYVRKPLYTYGCNTTSAVISNMHMNTSLTTIPSAADQSSEVPWFFRLSFLYLVPMGCFLTIIVGLLISGFTYNKNSPIKMNTLSPCIQTLLKKYKKTLVFEEDTSSDSHSKANTIRNNEEACVKYTFNEEK